MLVGTLPSARVAGGGDETRRHDGSFRRTPQDSQVLLTLHIVPVTHLHLQLFALRTSTDTVGHIPSIHSTLKRAVTTRGSTDQRTPTPAYDKAIRHGNGCGQPKTTIAVVRVQFEIATSRSTDNKEVPEYLSSAGLQQVSKIGTRLKHKTIANSPADQKAPHHSFRSLRNIPHGTHHSPRPRMCDRS